MSGADQNRIGELESRISQLESMIQNLTALVESSSYTAESDDSAGDSSFQDAIPVTVMSGVDDVEVDGHSIEEGEGEASGGFGGGALSIKGWGGSGKKEGESVTLTDEETEFDVLARSGDETKFVKLKVNGGSEPGGGDITMRGTDGSSGTGKDFTFESETYSNVTVKVEDATIKVGVYYV